MMVIKSHEIRAQPPSIAVKKLHHEFAQNDEDAKQSHYNQESNYASVIAKTSNLKLQKHAHQPVSYTVIKPKTS